MDVIVSHLGEDIT